MHLKKENVKVTCGLNRVTPKLELEHQRAAAAKRATARAGYATNASVHLKKESVIGTCGLNRGNPNLVLETHRAAAPKQGAGRVRVMVHP